MLTTDHIEFLKRIVQRPLTNVDFKDIGDLKTAQALTKLGYVRDYGQQWGRRVPIHLRIWGITEAGRAVLEQQHLAESKQRQMGLNLLKKKSLTIKTCVGLKTHQIRRRKKEPAPAADDDG